MVILISYSEADIVRTFFEKLCILGTPRWCTCSEAYSHGEERVTQSASNWQHPALRVQTDVFNKA